MASLKDIISFTNHYLKVGQFQDYCPNGLQVEGKKEIGHIISAVSSSYELFHKAQEKRGDLILVHHGLLWGNQPMIISGSFKRRIEYLFAHEVSLLAYHLPLDAHEEVGNNVMVANHLGLKDRKPFAEYKGNKIGVFGALEKRISLDDFIKKIESVFQTELTCYPFGKQQVKNVGIVTGGAAEQLSNAIVEECDLFLTGEVSETTMHLSKEEGINFIAAGHYNTEKFGVQALGDRIAKEFQLEHTFIDIPNPV